MDGRGKASGGEQEEGREKRYLGSERARSEGAQAVAHLRPREPAPSSGCSPSRRRTGPSPLGS